MSNPFGDDLNNPYAPSYSGQSTSGQGAPGSVPSGHSVGVFQQILVICIFQIVVGSLEIMMGLLFVFYAFILPIVFSQPNQPPPPPEVLYGMTIYVGSVAIILSISAGLRLYSGISGLYFRRRGLMIGSLIFGLLSFLSCYCIILAFPLAIYGLIIYFHPTVKQAYALRTQGMTPDEIRALLGR